MKVWITKYALTKGIFPAQVRVSDTTPKMVMPPSSAGNWTEYYHKPDWHETPAEALAQAEKMRVAALNAMEKKRRKLLSLDFSKTMVELPSELKE